MIRLLGALCILVSCSSYGFLRGQLWTDRLKQIRIIRRIFITLSGDIGYGSISLPESLERIAGQVDMPFSRFLKNISGEMRRGQGKPLDIIFREEIDRTLGYSALKPSDKAGLAQMGALLGSMDRGTQVQIINMYLQELDTTIADITDSIGSRQKLCRMLGVVSGILIIILLL